MARPQKYGLPTTGIKVPVELKDTIMFICFKYGNLDEKSRIEYIEQLNEETRKDFEEDICPMDKDIKPSKCHYLNNGCSMCVDKANIAESVLRING